MSANPGWLKIIDTSNWQPADIRAALQDPSIDGAIHQAGVPEFEDHVAQTKQLGKLCGSYLWFYDNLDPRGEAERHFALAAHLGLDFPPGLDAEGSVTRNPGIFAANCAAHQQRAQQLWSTVPMTYTAPGLWNGLSGRSTALAWTLLWNAQYPGHEVAPGAESPQLPDEWGGRYVGWQFQDAEQVGGLSLDCSWFRTSVLIGHSLPGAPTTLLGGIDMAALDLDDQLADRVRELYEHELGREPESGQVQAAAVQVAKTRGLDILRAAIYDSAEAQAFRARRGW